MLKMDDSEVLVGDKVYDTRYGPGTVVTLLGADDKIEVAFQTPKVQLIFTTGGQHGNNRRSLYWRDPVVAPPPKDEWRWAEARKLMLQVIKSFSRLRNA